MEATCSSFIQPVRRVKIFDDVQKWLKSPAYNDILGFITALNNAVKGKSSKCVYEKSKAVISIAALFDSIRDAINTIPLDEQEQRFGNKAFRVLGEFIVKNSQKWLEDCLPGDLKCAVIELKVYFDDCFGNYTRVDYGTGHEINFIAFICCLQKIGFFNCSDYVSIVFDLFNEYLHLMRKIQLWYKLEPAGSQGVWGLDDYQFLPFVFGSSQFLNNPVISPEQFVDPEIVSNYHEEYIFLECIRFINQVKTGPFGEHSNQLWNISSVQSWAKVNGGLIKMYKAEVLAKFPVIQHFLFGSLLLFDEPIHLENKSVTLE